MSSAIAISFFIFVMSLKSSGMAETSANPPENALFALFEAADSHHPLSKVSVSDVSAAHFQRAQTRGQYRPSLNLQGRVSSSERDAILQDESEFDDSLSPRSASLNLSHRLYDGGIKKLSLRRADLSVIAARQVGNAERLSIYAEIIQHAVDFARNQALLDLQARAADLLAEREDHLRGRRKVGDASQLDLHHVTARKARAATILIDTHGRVDAAQSALVSLTGIETSISFPPPDLTQGPVLLDEAQQRARDFSPAIKVRAAEEKTAKFEGEISQRRRLPTIGLAARASIAEEFSTVIDEETDLSIELNLSVPLYEGGVLSSRVGEARARQRSARHRRADEERRSDLQIATLYHHLESARKRIRAAQTGVSAAQAALLGAQTARDLGMSPELAVLDAIEEELLAKQTLTNAQYDWHLNRLLLALLTGNLTQG